MNTEKVTFGKFLRKKTLITRVPLISTPLTPEELASRKVHTLLDMLKYKRPAGSFTEKAFIERYIISLGCKPDPYGNYWYTIGDSKILWSSHLDTVHNSEGKHEIDIKDDFISLKKNTNSNCLGADCTTGVWLMREMIIAKVPGLYCFHREEECGGFGSHYVRTNFSKFLENIDFAIALDRKGYDSIITHQGMRTASDDFALSIQPQLPETGFKGDDTGLFTDTANYSDIISECTNLSIGYFDNHTPDETQDLRFAMLLCKHLIAFDESVLMATRDPNEIEYPPITYKSKYVSKFDDDWDNSITSGDLTETEVPNMVDLIEDHPYEVADILEQYGYDAKKLYAEIMEQYNS